MRDKRPSRSHEYIFLLTKSADAYWDELAAREPAISGGTRRMRSVWEIPVRGFDGKHRATFPPYLAQRAIALSTASGDRIIDPFSGSGTVGWVAPQLGRFATSLDIATLPER